jgi:hypothetical protein
MHPTLTEIAAIASRRMFCNATDMSNCEVILDRARVAQRHSLIAHKALQIVEDRRLSASDRMKAVAALFANDSVRAA